MSPTESPAVVGSVSRSHTPPLQPAVSPRIAPETSVTQVGNEENGDHISLSPAVVEPKAEIRSDVVAHRHLLNGVKQGRGVIKELLADKEYAPKSLVKIAKDQAAVLDTLATNVYSDGTSVKVHQKNTERDMHTRTGELATVLKFLKQAPTSEEAHEMLDDEASIHEKFTAELYGEHPEKRVAAFKRFIGSAEQEFRKSPERFTYHMLEEVRKLRDSSPASTPHHSRRASIVESHEGDVRSEHNEQHEIVVREPQDALPPPPPISQAALPAENRPRIRSRRVLPPPALYMSQGEATNHLYNHSSFPDSPHNADLRKSTIARINEAQRMVNALSVAPSTAEETLTRVATDQIKETLRSLDTYAP